MSELKKHAMVTFSILVIACFLVSAVSLVTTVSAQNENQGFFVSPGSFTIKDVPPRGEAYTIPRDIVIHNNGDNARMAFITVEIPSENEVAPGYEPIPMENWVRPVPSSVTVQENSSMTIQISMNLPNWENLTNKKWEVWIPVERETFPGEAATLQPTVRMKIETTSETGGVDGDGGGIGSWLIYAIVIVVVVAAIVAGIWLWRRRKSGGRTRKGMLSRSWR